MKIRITEKLWDLEACNTSKLNGYNCLSEYVSDVMSGILKKDVSFIIAPDYIGGRYTLDEPGYLKISDYLMTEIVDKYSLSPSKRIVVENSEENRIELTMQPSTKLFGDGELRIIPTLLLGSDLVITLGLGEYGDLRVYQIFYTQDSVNEALGIVQDLREFQKTLRIDNNERSIQVKFVMFRMGTMAIYDKTINLKDDLSCPALYPEDIPEKEMIEFLKSDESGIIILHGVPGGGKSTYIKHLILEYPEILFHLVDGGTVDKLDQFKKAIIENSVSRKIIGRTDQDKRKHKAYIIEDCEKILAPRNGIQCNAGMSDLLNLSDGIIGDLSGCKFILTFNSGENIDPAVLRKGRTKFMYEFKPITGPRLEELRKLAGIKELRPRDKEKGLTLAEIFNYEGEEYGKTGTKIGFN
jgi:hypothetical protein